MPMILLQDVPDAVDLPPLQTIDDELVAPCAGWTLMARPNLCIVEGPVNVGFLLPVPEERESDAPELDEFRRWLISVEAAEGAVLVAAESVNGIRSVANVVERPGLRGGFVPAT
jgi:hypothetical protein